MANKANKDIGAALFEEGRGHMRPFAYDLADANAGTLQRKLRNTIQRKTDRTDCESTRKVRALECKQISGARSVRNMRSTCRSLRNRRDFRGLNEGGVKSHARVATSPHRTFLSHSDRLYGGYGWKRCYWSRTRDVPVHGSAKASARGLLGQNKKQRYFAMCKRCARRQTT